MNESIYVCCHAALVVPSGYHTFPGSVPYERVTYMCCRDVVLVALSSCHALPAAVQHECYDPLMLSCTDGASLPVCQSV
jgi:hypothetical protein